MTKIRSQVGGAITENSPRLKIICSPPCKNKLNYIFACKLLLAHPGDLKEHPHPYQNILVTGEFTKQIINADFCISKRFFHFFISTCFHVAPHKNTVFNSNKLFPMIGPFSLIDESEKLVNSSEHSSSDIQIIACTSKNEVITLSFFQVRLLFIKSHSKCGCFLLLLLLLRKFILSQTREWLALYISR